MFAGSVLFLNFVAQCCEMCALSYSKRDRGGVKVILFKTSNIVIFVLVPIRLASAKMVNIVTLLVVPPLKNSKFVYFFFNIFQE